MSKHLTVLELFAELKSFAVRHKHREFINICKHEWHHNYNEMLWLIEAYGSWESLYDSLAGREDADA